jgi:hypothetical protein
MYEVYLFYISLAGVVLLLLYKATVVRQYDRVNKNSIHFDPFPKARMQALRIFQAFVVILQIFVVKPLGRVIFSGVVLLARFGGYLLTIVRNFGGMVKRNRLTSGYVQKMGDLKKRVQRKIRRDLKK